MNLRGGGHCQSYRRALNIRTPGYKKKIIICKVFVNNLTYRYYKTTPDKIPCYWKETRKCTSIKSTFGTRDIDLPEQKIIFELHILNFNTNANNNPYSSYHCHHHVSKRKSQHNRRYKRTGHCCLSRWITVTINDYRIKSYDNNVR